MARTLAGIFRALSDETRLRILAVLSEASLCVGELVSVLEVHQPKVSRHLAYLRRVGLVRTIRSGRNITYELTRPDPNLRGVLRAIPRALLSEDQSQQDRARLQLLLARADAL